jgi:hypothetical protein
MSMNRGRKSKKNKPDPAENDLQQIIDGIIDESYLTKCTGSEDLSSLTHLSLQIDTSFQSIFQLSDFLPNLESLVLDNSTISTVRDLGVGLRCITSLSMSNCGLHDLDGIGVLLSLRELNISGNLITEVSPLAMHDQLESLDISGNKLVDISIAVSLASCSQLKALVLSRNVLARAPNYRLIIASLIPSLTMLDGSLVDPNAQTKVTNGMILEAAASMKLIEEEMDDELRLEMDCILTQDMKRLGGSHLLPSPGGTLSPGQGYSGVVPDTGSELTHGSSVVLAGNMAAAMRKRRNKQSQQAKPCQCQA